jgi:ketosteroid isomerase-like protein
MWTAILATTVSLFLIDLPVATPHGQPRATDAGDREELTRLETVWNEAHVKGDAEALDRLWADDLVVTVSGMPLMNKPDSLVMIRAGRMGFSKYDTSELVVRTYGDSAVVTGRVQR